MGFLEEAIVFKFLTFATRSVCFSDLGFGVKMGNGSTGSFFASLTSIVEVGFLGFDFKNLRIKKE